MRWGSLFPFAPSLDAANEAVTFAAPYVDRAIEGGFDAVDELKRRMRGIPGHPVTTVAPGLGAALALTPLMRGVYDQTKSAITAPRDALAGRLPMTETVDTPDGPVQVDSPETFKRSQDVAFTAPLGAVVPGAGGASVGMLNLNKPVVKPKLVVAMRHPQTGETIYGKPGQVHGDLYNEYGLFPNEGDIGFAAGEGAPFMGRAEALDFVKNADPSTASGLTRSARSGQLESNDLAVASGDYVNAPPLVNMPTTADVPGMGAVPFGPTPAIRQTALDYMKEQGLPYTPPRKYVPVDPEKAAKVADEFEKMKHDPTDPQVAKSYSALIDETKKQFQAIQKSGLKIDFIKPGMEDPYRASPRLAQKDIVDNNHLWVFPTEGGFGPAGAKYEANHPMLADSGVEIGGYKLKNNDLFRIVHDVFGHAKEGVGFRATGEDNAFRQHRAMFTPDAQRALATETRGQNSWLNFGPHGGKNRTATADQTIFADQKVGLLPDWAVLYANNKKAAPLSLAAASDFPFDNPNAKVVTTADDPFDAPLGLSANQTVLNPTRNEFPGIYGDPREIAAAAAQNVAPEDPALKQVFGVTRDDLYEIGGRGTRAGNAEPNFAAAAGKSKAAQQIMTPQNAQRLVDILSEVEKTSPDLVKGMDSWYVMDPAYKRLEQLVGPQEAKKRFKDLVAYMGMASPGSNVMTEINRGTAANYLARNNRFGDFVKYGGVEMKKRRPGRGFPSDMMDVTAHAYHKTAHSKPMKLYNELGDVTMQSAKVPLYIQASGVPEIGFQTKLPVGDAHFTRALGVPDVRKAEVTKNASMKSPLYTPIGNWFREEVANPLGVQAVPAQARLWGTMAHITGVDTPVGAPKLELMARRIIDRAKELGISPEQLRDEVLMGMNYSVNPITLTPLSLAASARDKKR